VNNYRNIVLWIIIGLFLVALFNLFQGGRERMGGIDLPYSEFLTAVDAGNIQEVTIRGNTLTGRMHDGRLFSSFAPLYDNKLVERLENKKVRFSAAPADEGGSSLLSHILGWIPMLLLVGIWIFFLRQMQSGNNKALGFGKSRARLLNEQKQKVTFADVAGVDEAKQEVQEIVEFLKDPQKFQKLGGKIPKGVLLVGNPGTGKTLLARAIAGEANVPFFSISGSDFVEMFVGVGASRVRDLFEQGKKNAPCIIFIDEIDAVGRHRGIGLGGGNDEREQTLNQLLVEMDGFEANEGVILIAATNRPDVLDPALTRPGRFDRQVVVPLPDITGREQILGVHMARVPVGADVDIKVIARGTPGFSGADLANLVNEAALLAARQNKRVVTQSDFEAAKDKILMGPERRSMVMTDEEKKLTAYHEGGHAIVAHHLPDSDPIHKATIIPRGRALGMVVRLPERDRFSESRIKLQADLAVAMGGRVAEEIIFGADKVTTGASSDIRFATQIARKMVTSWGLSALGPIEYGDPNAQDVFLGHSIGHTKNLSDATAQKVDNEIQKIIETAYNTARQILLEHTDDLHKLAAALLEYETLTGEEINQLLTGKGLKKSNRSPIKTTKPRRSTPYSQNNEEKEGTPPEQET
jgi:cell division protease FtsH